MAFIKCNILLILSPLRMKINATEKFGNWVSYLDSEMLTSKALRTKVLQNFVLKINEKIGSVLDSINCDLITDPAVIVSPKYYKFIDQIINDSVNYWQKIHFPTMDTLFVRTSGFDSSFAFPYTETSLSQDLTKVVDDIKKFLEFQKPQEIILHPRVDRDMALEKLYAMRSKSIPGDTHVQIGKGGQWHIRTLENTLEHYEFNYQSMPLDMPPEFKNFSKYLSIITPVADAVYLSVKTNKDVNILPVYEFKGLNYDGISHINMFDYET